MIGWVLGVWRKDEPLSQESVRQSVQSLEPQRTQLLLVVIVDGTDPRRWEAGLIRNGDFHPLDEVLVNGTGMLRLHRDEDQPDHATDPRWSRTVGALGCQVVQRLSQSTVTLIGAGRTGSQLAFQLAAVGVNRLRILDPDYLAIENLDAMPGLTVADLGQSKVLALGKRLLEFRPDLGLSLLEKSVTEPEAQDFLRCRTDLLVTCVDHDTPRLAAASVSVQTQTAHLDLGTSLQRRPDGTVSMSGDIRLVVPGGGCVACVGGLADFHETSYDLHAPRGSLRRRMRPSWHEERAGSLISWNAIVVGSAVQQWLDLLGGRLRTSFWQRMLWIPGQGIQSDGTTVGAAEACLVCGGTNDN